MNNGPDRAPAAYSPGELIDNRYRVVAFLGAGGFSQVYQVFDTFREADYALKLFQPSIGLDAALREINALKAIHHPNIVRVIDVGKTPTVPQQWYIKSELAVGTSLALFVVPGSKRLSVAEIARIGAQLLSALGTLHPNLERMAQLERVEELSETEYRELMSLQEAGLIHRDVKPENIVLTPTGDAILLDFNIASRAGAPVVTEAHTPGYRPPDPDLTRWDVDVDLYATAVVLYELLVQSMPPDRRAELPDPLRAFFVKALAAVRSERFRSAREMSLAWCALLGIAPEPGGDESIADTLEFYLSSRDELSASLWTALAQLPRGDTDLFAEAESNETVGSIVRRFESALTDSSDWVPDVLVQAVLATWSNSLHEQVLSIAQRLSRLAPIDVRAAASELEALPDVVGRVKRSEETILARVSARGVPSFDGFFRAGDWGAEVRCRDTDDAVGVLLAAARGLASRRKERNDSDR